MKFRQHIGKLLMICAVAAIALGGLLYALQNEAVATTGEPGYDIVLDAQDAPIEPGYDILDAQDAPQDAPECGRPAPYCQWLVTHNNVGVITWTANYGTVAKTCGYDPLKSVICENKGTQPMTVSLYLRTTSTGDLYNLRPDLVTIPASTKMVISYTDVAPWTSVGIVSSITGTTATCGIYVQSP